LFIVINLSNLNKMKNSSELATKLLEFRNQIVVLQWQTDSYAQHKALGGLYESLDDSIDELVETFAGINGKEAIHESFVFSADNLGESGTEPVAVLNRFVSFLSGDLSKLFAGNTDLLNMRDSILGEVNHALYLLTFK